MFCLVSHAPIRPAMEIKDMKLLTLQARGAWNLKVTPGEDEREAHSPAMNYPVVQ